MSTHGHPDWPAVAAAAQRRRVELNLTQAEVAELSLVSLATVRRIEQAPAGSNFSARVLIAVSKALGLPGDALERVSRGEALPAAEHDPTPPRAARASTTTAAPIASTDDMKSRLIEVLAAIDRSGGLNDDDLDPEVVDAFAEATQRLLDGVRRNA